jgi:hypothetical protein
LFVKYHCVPFVTERKYTKVPEIPVTVSFPNASITVGVPDPVGNSTRCPAVVRFKSWNVFDDTSVVVPVFVNVTVPVP